MAPRSTRINRAIFSLEWVASIFSHASALLVRRESYIPLGLRRASTHQVEHVGSYHEPV